MYACTWVNSSSNGIVCVTVLQKALQALRVKVAGPADMVVYGWTVFLVSVIHLFVLPSILKMRSGYNYLAFDIIGDLAFGSPFGMIMAGQDSAPVAISQEDAMNSYGGNEGPKVKRFPAVQILNDRGEYSATMGVLPPWMRPIVRKLPWFAKGNNAVKNLAGLAVAAVAKRLTTPTDRVDLLSKLQEGKDDEGQPMGRPELTAEALTQLIAGSDTTSK